MRFDLTSEKRYSLSENTIKLLKNLDQEVYIKVYLEGDLEAGFLRLRNATEDLLVEMKSHNSSKINYEFVNPVENLEKSTDKNLVYQQMMDKGLFPTNLKIKKDDESYKEQIIFPCMLLRVAGQEIPIQILENQVGISPEDVLNNSQIALEYKVIHSIDKALNPERKLVTMLQGHDELDTNKTKSLVDVLTQNRYLVTFTNIREKRQSSQGDSIGTWFDEKSDLVIIAKPKLPFTEIEKFRLDQYVMNGGKILWILDMVDAEMNYFNTKGLSYIAGGLELNLDDILFQYGVRVNQNLLQDIQDMAPIKIVDNETNEPLLVPWLFSPLLTGNSKHPVSKNLAPMLTNFASGMDTISNTIQKTVLLSTSAYGKAFPQPVRVNLGLVKEKPDPKYFKTPHIPVAILLEGEFESVFKNRLSLDFIKQLEAIGYQTKTKSPKSKMIVISDGNFAQNEVSPTGKIMPAGFDINSQTRFANLDFLLNSIEYLTDSSGLMIARNKETKVRKLDINKTKSEKTTWQLINIVLPLGISAGFTLAYQYYRRRKWKNFD
jgi:ABC-2 type transport system permease protein